jgi:hypothetical protein
MWCYYQHWYFMDMLVPSRYYIHVVVLEAKNGYVDETTSPLLAEYVGMKLPSSDSSRFPSTYLAFPIFHHIFDALESHFRRTPEDVPRRNIIVALSFVRLGTDLEHDLAHDWRLPELFHQALCCS